MSPYEVCQDLVLEPSFTLAHDTVYYIAAGMLHSAASDNFAGSVLAGVSRVAGR